MLDCALELRAIGNPSTSSLFPLRYFATVLFVAVAMIKHHDPKQILEGILYLGLQFHTVRVDPGGEAWQQVADVVAGARS